MSKENTCQCPQCRLMRTIDAFAADNPGASPKDALDGVAYVLGQGIGEAFNATGDSRIASALIERAVRQMSHAACSTTKGKLRVELNEVTEHHGAAPPRAAH